MLWFVVRADYAKGSPAQVIVWPETGTPDFRFAFGKFKEVGSLGSKTSSVTETTAENLGTKHMNHANVSLYLFDKNNTAHPEAVFKGPDLDPGKTIRLQTTSDQRSALGWLGTAGQAAGKNKRSS